MNVEVKELVAPEHPIDRETVESYAAVAYEARVHLYRAEREVASIRHTLYLSEANVLTPARDQFADAMSRLRRLIDNVEDDSHVPLAP